MQKCESSSEIILVVRYGLMTSLLSCIFGLILYAMTADFQRYGNYSNTIGGFVAIQFYFMSITASVIAAYYLSYYLSGKKEISQRKKAGYGMLTALVVTLIPAIICLGLVFTLINDLSLQFFAGMQIYLVPLPAVILGGIIGYFVKKEGPVKIRDFKGYFLILSVVLFLELIVPVSMMYLAVSLNLVPYDFGRIIPGI